jgi:hypothetical protein
VNEQVQHVPDRRAEFLFQLLIHKWTGGEVIASVRLASPLTPCRAVVLAGALRQ